MDYFSGWCTSRRRLDGYTVVVTGSNSGIGKETASDFYSRGARVIMACRNITKAEEAKRDIEKDKEAEETGTLIIEKLDLCSLQSVREFAARVLEREARIQVLVNNAGVMMCPEGRTEDGFEAHIGSNHFGHALLTLLLLPTLVKSAPSRIVNVSSAISFFHKIDLDDINLQKTRYNALDAYSRSKIANIMFAKALAQKLKEQNINNVTTYSLHPGIVHTNISKHFDETTWFFISRLFNNYFVKWLWKTPRCGAQTTIYCAVDEACANETGLYYSDCVATPAPRQCRDDNTAAKLWDVTVEMLKLQNYNSFGNLYTNSREKLHIIKTA